MELESSVLLDGLLATQVRKIYDVSYSGSPQAIRVERSQHRPVCLLVSSLLRQRDVAIDAQDSLPIVRAAPGERQPPIRTQARAATILPNFVGLKFQVHNGKVYFDITITEDMVGHRLGEFAP